MLLSRSKLIRLIAFDVDGVMTDGGLYFSDSGEEFKRFNSLDGHGIKMLRASKKPRYHTCFPRRGEQTRSNGPSAQ
jgi:3-deoxy-D-manno-octulosonate 8-phosphate phosphatase KdsC-like HAD superfamily phosphatase